MTLRRAVGQAIRLRNEQALPLREQFRLTQHLRAAVVLLLLLAALLTPGTLAPGRTAAVLSTVVYAGVVLLAELLSRLRTTQGGVVAPFSAMLVVDGVWLAWAGYLTGGLASPVRYLVLAHVGAVALLAPLRTVARLALWHSTLLCAVHLGQTGGALVPTAPDAAVSHPGQQLAVFVGVLWLVTASTFGVSARSESELRRRRNDLERLTTLAERLEGAGDGKNVARLLLDSARETVDARRGLVLAGPEGQLPLLSCSGLDEETARRPGRPGPSAVVDVAHAAQTTQVVRGLDAAREPWLSRLLPDAQDLVLVPLVAEDKPLGALVLELQAGSGGRVDPRVTAALERSASYAALALRNAWLLEQVQRLAATDGLTKIANRRTFEATLEREVARATRNDEHVSLVLVDIDHFKALNDTHGHQAGDEVLRNVAAALSCECRDFDTPARYGGEEFAIVLPGCGPEEAVSIAERLRRAVAAAPSIVAITASAGVATYPGHAGDADTLVRAADEALYASKNAGRNRTTQSAGVPPQAQVDALLRRAVSQRLGRASEPGALPPQAGAAPWNSPSASPTPTTAGRDSHA